MNYVEQARKIAPLKYYCLSYDFNKSHESINTRIIKDTTAGLIAHSSLQENCASKSDVLNIHIEMELDTDTATYRAKNASIPDQELYGEAEIKGTIYFKSNSIEHAADFTGRYIIQKTRDIYNLSEPSGAPFNLALRMKNSNKHKIALYNFMELPYTDYLRALIYNVGLFDNGSFLKSLTYGSYQVPAIEAIAISGNPAYGPTVLKRLTEVSRAPEYTCRQACVQAMQTLGIIQYNGDSNLIQKILDAHKNVTGDELDVLHTGVITLARIHDTSSLNYLMDLKKHIRARVENTSPFSGERQRLIMLDYDIKIAIEDLNELNREKEF